MKSQIQLLIFRLRSMSFGLRAVKCKGEGCPGDGSESPQLEIVGHKMWPRGQCMFTILFSGSKWIVTAAHCLLEVLDSEDVTLHHLELLSPSAFKIIVGECEPS